MQSLRLLLPKLNGGDLVDLKPYVSLSLDLKSGFKKKKVLHLIDLRNLSVFLIMILHSLCQQAQVYS